MNYAQLRFDYPLPADRIWVVERLEELRRQLAAKVPPKDAMDSLLLATWNIREFDSNSYGARLRESYYYIGEIISRFDLVAVQEVREDLKALRDLMKILGPWWEYIATDITEGASGNGERMAFLYDTRKVKFRNIAGEVVLAPSRSRVSPDDDATLDAGEGPEVGVRAAEQLARTPFLCAFQAEWFKFSLCTVHIYYGKSVADDPRRVREIEYIADFLAGRAQRESDVEGGAFILLGDFNIFKPTDITMQKLTEAGFMVPEKLQNLPEAVAKGKHYDQIAFLKTGGRIDRTEVQAGMVDYYQSVFREGDKGHYEQQMVKPGTNPPEHYTSYSQWRTHQLSDHLPLWVKIPINDAESYLSGLKK